MNGPARRDDRAPLPAVVDPELLLALVNHELRTPLTMMVGYSEMLLGGEAGALNEEQQAMVLAVERSASRVQDLVLDLLTLAGEAIGQDRCRDDVAQAVRRLGGEACEATSPHDRQHRASA